MTGLVRVHPPRVCIIGIECHPRRRWRGLAQVKIATGTPEVSRAYASTTRPRMAPVSSAHRTTRARRTRAGPADGRKRGTRRGTMRGARGGGRDRQTAQARISTGRRRVGMVRLATMRSPRLCGSDARLSGTARLAASPRTNPLKVSRNPKSDPFPVCGIVPTVRNS